MTKIKQFVQDDRVFYSILLILIAVTAFGLGRQSILSSTVSATDNEPERRVELVQPAAIIESFESTAAEEVVASKNGTRYYYPHCPGIERINDENKVTFTSVATAEAAGYTLALQCEN